MNCRFGHQTVLRIALFIASIFFISFSPVSADTTSYKITDPMVLPSPAVPGRVLLWKTYSVNYKGGPMVLSKNPDGTGDMMVGDMLQLHINKISVPLSNTFTYKAFEGKYCAPPIKLMPPTNLAMHPYFTTPGLYNVLVRYIGYCRSPKDISSIYLVNLDPLPTSAPVTPTPAGPAPFLELPWDYAGQGKSFTESALSMSAFFDHEFPLLSSGGGEGENNSTTVIRFDAPNRTRDSYSSHDGYDYGRFAGTKYDTPVLAAAAGTATYINTCGPCGNVIHIDHGNGYQTRYYHLQKDGLVVSTPGQSVHVDAGQQIGKVGASGNVQPPGPEGSHIHFMVVEDKDDDGNFADNIPDGLTDPYGWKPAEPDPWETFTFTQNGAQKTGNQSHWLWKHKIENTQQEVPKEQGGTLARDHFSLTLAPDYYQEALQFELAPAPAVELDETTRSLGPAMEVTALDALGEFITSFINFFTVTFDYSDEDLTGYNSATLAIYSSDDGETWTKENSTIDETAKKVTAQVNHLTHFALMAERADTEAPATTATLDGELGVENWFRSDVQVTLNAVDNPDPGGLGVDYILYRTQENADFEKYTEPVVFTSEGDHMIEFYATDNDGNVELPQKVNFHIDKTHPEAHIYFDQETIDLIFTGTDSATLTATSQTTAVKKESDVMIADKAGNSVNLRLKDVERGALHATVNIFSIWYNDEEPEEQVKNRLVINYREDKKGRPEKDRLTQSWFVKDDLTLRLRYIGKTDETEVITKEKGQERVKEKLPGVNILQLSTDNGTINYRY